MHLEEIILDGFKSYAQYTSISALDPQFTAITGLNGSGKSNIFDAICFVLGITSLERIRVNSLTELIYKQGQAGITKAQVSLIFNNEDVGASPSGFENVPKINITRMIFQNGTTKYLINNQVAKQKSLKQLFESVNMNINNPNFLIMQGRIQAILSMKPSELLSLLEETAGTSLYEENRKEAVKTFDQKQAKLEQIQRIINEDIKPKIEKLENERKTGVQIAFVQKAIGVLEVVEEFSKIEQCYANNERLELEIHRLQEQEGDAKRSLQQLENDVIRINAELLNYGRGEDDSEIQALEKQLDQKQSQIAIQRQKEELVAQKRSDLEARKLENEGQIKLFEGKIDRIEQQIAQLQASKQGEEMTKMQQELDYCVQEQSKLNAEVAIIKTGEVNSEYFKQYLQEDNEDMLHKISLTVFQNTDFLTLNEIVSRLEELLILRQAKIKDGQQEITANEQEVMQLNNELIKARTDDLSVQNEMQEMKQEIEAELQLLCEQCQTPLPDDSLESLQEVREQIKVSIQEELLQVEKQKHEYELEQINYENEVSERQKLFMDALLKSFKSAPSILSMINGIQNKAEYGLLGSVLDNCTFNTSLINSLKGSKDKLYKALELAAGNKMFNIIFNTSKEAASFVTGRQCTQRITCLPLDSIKGKQLQQEEISIIEEHKGYLLSDFIVPKNEDYRDIFAFLFGQTAIVSDLNDAHSIAYNKSCGVKCVTLEGDIVDPNGIVTGGSRQSKANYLALFLDYLDIQMQKQSELVINEEEIQEKDKLFEEFEHNLSLFEEKQQNYEESSQLFSVEKKIDSITGNITELSRDISQEEEEFDLLRVLLSETQKQENSKSTQRTFEEVSDELNQVTRSIEEIEQKINENKENSVFAQTEKLKLQVEGLTQQKNSKLAENKELDEEYNESLEQNVSLLPQLEEQYRKQLEEMEELKVEKNQIEFEYEELQDKAQYSENELQKQKDEFERQVEELKKANLQYTEYLTETQEHISNIEEFLSVFVQLTGNNAVLKNLKTKRAEISFEVFSEELVDSKLIQDNAESKEFVLSLLKSNSLLMQHIANKQEELQELHEQQKGFSGTTANLEEMQKSAHELIEMQQKLEKDRQKIIQVIEKVDQKKEEALEEVFESVNSNLNAIFATLLTNASAGLQKIDNGIQFVVKLGSTRTTLSGLSGGEKSLLALSFTLALLKYKPSPIYILDEIDSALDLSHTHNIGELIQEEFGGSEFIIISLKEGMFNHANKLVRVKFNEGMSKIEIVK